MYIYRYYIVFLVPIFIFSLYLRSTHHQFLMYHRCMARDKDKKIALFEGSQIRRHWDEVKELWYFSVVDVVGVLSDSVDARNYWKVLKNR